MEWLFNLKYRLKITVPEHSYGGFLPLDFDINFSQFVKEDICTETILPVQVNINKGEPVIYNPEISGIGKFKLPFRFEGERGSLALPVKNPQKGVLTVLLKEAAESVIYIYFDTNKNLESMNYSYNTCDSDTLKMEFGPLCSGALSKATIVDFNGDGIKDLLVTQIEHIQYFENVGTNEEPVFEQRGLLCDDTGKNIRYFCFKPYFIDWDGDGLIDLLISARQDSFIHYYRNTGTAAEPIYHHEGILKDASGNPISCWEPDMGGTSTDPARKYDRLKHGKGDYGFLEVLDKKNKRALLLGNTAGNLYIYKNIKYGEGTPILAGNPVNTPWGEIISRGNALTDTEGKPIHFAMGSNPYLIEFTATKPDLYIGCYYGQYRFYKNISEQPYELKLQDRGLLYVDGEIFNIGNHPSLHLVDWKENGELELLAGNRLGRLMRLSVFEKDPEGIPNLKKKGHVMAKNTEFPLFQGYPFLIDWDGDGIKDLVIGNEPGTIVVYKNIGTNQDPVFSPDFKYIKDQFGPICIQGRTDAYFPYYGYSTVEIADWNNDGKLDIIAGSDMGYVYYFKNNSSDNMTFENMGRLKDCNGDLIKVHQRARVLLFDWDNDGLPELYVSGSTCPGYYPDNDPDGSGSHVRVYKIIGTASNGDPILGAPNKLMIDGREFNGGYANLCPVDWDGDGKTDIIAYSTKLGYLNNLYPNSTGIHFIRNVGTVDEPKFAFEGTISLKANASSVCGFRYVEWTDEKKGFLFGSENCYIHFISLAAVMRDFHEYKAESKRQRKEIEFQENVMI